MPYSVKQRVSSCLSKWCQCNNDSVTLKRSASREQITIEKFSFKFRYFLSPLSQYSIKITHLVKVKCPYLCHFWQWHALFFSVWQLSSPFHLDMNLFLDFVQFALSSPAMCCSIIYAFFHHPTTTINQRKNQHPHHLVVSPLSSATAAELLFLE